MSNVKFDKELSERLLGLMTESDRDAPVQFYVGSNEMGAQLTIQEKDEFRTYPLNWDTAVYLGARMYQHAIYYLQSEGFTREQALERVFEYWKSIYLRG